jgi:hypothetical protein
VADRQAGHTEANVQGPRISDTADCLDVMETHNTCVLEARAPPPHLLSHIRKEAALWARAGAKNSV